MYKLPVRKKDLIQVNGLVKYFPVRAGLLQRVTDWVQAVDGVSFTIREGETLGLVGESGCGKSTLARTILRLINPLQGEIIFQDNNLTNLKHTSL